MRVWATIHYENTFLMEVPATASQEEIEGLIFQKDADNSHGGSWTTAYEVETEWEDEK